MLKFGIEALFAHLSFARMGGRVNLKSSHGSQKPDQKSRKLGEKKSENQEYHQKIPKRVAYQKRNTVLLKYSRISEKIDLFPE